MMAQLIRKVNRSNWEPTSWLQEHEAPGDTLKDLVTKGCSLSFWRVETEAQIDDVVVALAVNSKAFDKVDILLLEESVIGGLGIKISTTPGETPYEEVNPLHVSLEELTTKKLDALSVTLFEQGEHRRSLRAQVIAMAEAVKSKLNKDMLEEGISSRLNFQ